MSSNPIVKWSRRLLLFLCAAAFVLVVVAYWSSTNDCARTVGSATTPMKSYVYCDYGLANLKLADIEKPTPAENQVLVRVRATSINPYDWHFIEGTPYFIRIFAGLRKPKDIRIGVDFAGTIEAIGKNVTEFKPGDDVFGGKGGAFAQYVCVRASGVALKPPAVTFEQAGSCDIAGVTALQALRDKAQAQRGQKILINGASGGVGTFAVQIAKWLGADVTGVCSTRNIDLVRSLGADRVIDYTQEDFTKTGEHYDAVIDNVGNRSLSECRRLLTPSGRYVMIGGGGMNEQGLFGLMLRPVKAMIMSPFVSQKMGMMMAQANQKDLTILGELMASGTIKPVIDRTYKFAELPDAIRYVEAGHARGKVVVAVE